MSWRKVKLGELVDNFSVRAKDVGGAIGLDFFGVSNDDGIIKTKYAAEDKAEDYKIIEKGCFAYNPYRVNVGSIGLVSDETRGLISPAYVIFKPKPNSIIPELLLKFLKSNEGLSQIIFYARGTVRQALRFEDLCNIEISIPDFSEQMVLYKKLINSQESSNVLDLELKNQLNLVKKLRQQLLQDAVQGKLVKQNPKDEPANELLKKIKAEKEKLIAAKTIKEGKEIPKIKLEDQPYQIPENWVWCRLGEIAYITSGSTPAQSAFVEKGIPYLKMYNLRNQVIDFFHKPQYIKEEIHNGQLKRCRAYPGDILMNIVGPPLGKIAIIPDDLPECNFNQAAVLIRPFIKEMNFFVSWYLNEMSEINSIDTKGIAGQANISVTQAHNMRIPLPPLKEQTLIVKKLDELMQNCGDLEASIKQSAAQNEKLLQQVLKEALRK